MPGPSVSDALPHSRTASSPHELEPFLDHATTNQDRLRPSRTDGHDVEAAVETVDEIDVGVAGLAPHRLGARCAATAVGVAGGIIDPEIRLDLGHAKDDFTT